MLIPTFFYLFPIFCQKVILSSSPLTNLGIQCLSNIFLVPIQSSFSSWLSSGRVHEASTKCDYPDNNHHVFSLWFTEFPQTGLPSFPQLFSSARPNLTHLSVSNSKKPLPEETLTNPSNCSWILYGRYYFQSCDTVLIYLFSGEKRSHSFKVGAEFY